jgi:hypothetical protein
MSVFVNQIDELIDRSLDKFFEKYVYQNKLFNKLSTEIDFVKYQLNLHTAIDEFCQGIDRNALSAIVTQAENVKRIIDIVKRYIAYYSLMWVAYHYSGKRIEYVNNVVELGTGQQRSTFRIANFYNSDNNATLFRLYDLIRDVVFVLSIDKPKASILGTPHGVAQYRNALDFLDELGTEFVQKHLKIKGSVGVHNLIKTITVIRLYKGEEKTDAIRILQEAELEKGEYTYIDIIVPRVQHFDFSTIESLLTPRQLRAGIADEIYDTLNQQAEKREMSVDEKVSILMNSGILVPIVEDFMLLHKDTEKYEREQQIDKRARADDTRLRYIVSKIDAVAELFSPGTVSSEQRREQIEKLMYAPLRERRVVLINEIEEIKIINKIENQGKQTENTEFYHDLQSYRVYPYVSFKALKRQGFPYTTSKTVLAVRSTNFEFAKELRNVPLDVRAASSLTPINVVGFVIRPLGSPVQCYKVGDVIDIREFTMKARTSGKIYKTDNGFLGTKRFLKQAIIKGRSDGPAMHWILDIEKDKFDVKGYEPISSTNTQEYLKLLLAHIYDSIEEMTVIRITSDLRKLYDRGEIYSVTEIEKYVREVERRTLPLNDRARKQIASTAFHEFYPLGGTEYDKLEDMYPGLDSDLIPIQHLSLVGGEIIDNIPLDAFELSQDTGDAVAVVAKSSESLITAGMAAEANDTGVVGEKLLEYISRDLDYQQATCQHVLSWQETMQYKRDRDNSQYEEGLFNFIQMFVRKTDDDDYACKSCDELLPIKHFVVDGVFDDGQQRFITFAIPMDTPLHDMREYEKYGKVIRDLDLRISSICEMINLKFYVGHATAIKWRRKTIVKNVLDLLLTHNRILKNNYKKRNETATEMYGIERKLSNLFFFDIDDSVVDYSSRDKDFFRLVKINNITAYIIFAIILELNDEQIASLGKDKKARVDKLCTLDFYDRVAPTLFDKLYILRSTDGTREAISSIPNFGYTLFIISCILTRNRRWYMEESDKTDKKFDPIMQKSIIHTVTDLINSIIEVYALPEENRPWLYTIMGSRFMNHIKTVYESPQLDKRMVELRAPPIVDKKDKRLLPREKTGDLVVPPGEYHLALPVLFTREKSLRLKWAGHTSARAVPEHRPITAFNPVVHAEIDNETNCPDGKFHKWINKDNEYFNKGGGVWKGADDDLMCKKCGASMDKIIASGEINPDEEVKLLDNVYVSMIDHLSLSVCINGMAHTYHVKNGKMVCSNCGRERDQPPSSNDVRDLKKILDKQHELPITIVTHEEVSKKILKHIAELQTESPAAELIAIIQKVVGKDAKLIGDRELLNDTYIVERDYIGNRLSKPITLGSKDGKLKYRTDHPFFKSNVMYYTDEHREVDVYYDAITHAYLGFRERNREYVKADEPHYLKINWSLKSQLELIGFSGVHMRIKREAAELGITEVILEEEDGFQQLIDMLYGERFRRIYQTVGEVVRIIYTISNGQVGASSYNAEGEKEESNPDEPDVSLVLMQQYAKNLAKVQTGSDETPIFSGWNDLLSNMQPTKTPAGEKPEEWLSAHDLARDDVTSKAALHYLSIELSRLIELNNDKFTAANLINLIVQIINHVFNMWNQDASEHEVEIKRFMMLMDMRRGFDASYKTSAEDESEVMNSDGTGAITDDVPDIQAAEPEDAEEMTTLAELVEGGAEMERDDEFISDYAADREI